MLNLDYMQIALRLAADAAAMDEVPVAAVITDGSGEIIAQAQNQMRTLGDPTAHAEMLAMQQAAKILGQARLVDCDLYVTLEPCAMCAAAISLYRLRRVYFGAYDAKGGGIEHGPRFYQQPTCHHRPEVYGGIAAAKSETLLQNFFRSKRDHP
jgi:tRNA(adenine34) deaminase